MGLPRFTDHLPDVPCPLPRRIEWVHMSITSPSARPSPIAGRVGIRDFTFEACSGFTHVTARPVAQPPKAAFVTRLRSCKRRMPTRSCVICTFESPSRGGSGQPPRPRVMRGVPGGQREVSTGETTGGHLQSGHYLDTYANIDQGQRRRLHLSLPRLPKSSPLDKIPQTGIVGDDHMMMWDTDSDEIAGILLKVDRAARRE